MADDIPPAALARIESRAMAEVRSMGRVRVGGTNHLNSFVAAGRVVEICYCVGHDHDRCTQACHGGDRS